MTDAGGATSGDMGRGCTGDGRHSGFGARASPRHKGQRWDGGLTLVIERNQWLSRQEHSRGDTICHRDLQTEVSIDERRFADGLVTVVWAEGHRLV